MMDAENGMAIIAPILEEMKDLDCKWRHERDDLSYALIATGPNAFWKGRNTHELIAMAAGGNAAADRWLRGVAAALLEQGQQLSPEMGQFAAGAIRTAPARQNAKPGPHKNDDVLRNAYIWLSITRLTEQGFKPTRSPATTKSHSACSLVAQGLARAGIHMSEAAVVKVWQACRVPLEKSGT